MAKKVLELCLKKFQVMNTMLSATGGNDAVVFNFTLVCPAAGVGEVSAQKSYPTQSGTLSEEVASDRYDKSILFKQEVLGNTWLSVKVVSQDNLSDFQQAGYAFFAKLAGAALGASTMGIGSEFLLALARAAGEQSLDALKPQGNEINLGQAGQLVDLESLGNSGTLELELKPPNSCYKWNSELRFNNHPPHTVPDRLVLKDDKVNVHITLEYKVLLDD